RAPVREKTVSGQRGSDGTFHRIAVTFRTLGFVNLLTSRGLPGGVHAFSYGSQLPRVPVKRERPGQCTGAQKWDQAHHLSPSFPCRGDYRREHRTNNWGVQCLSLRGLCTLDAALSPISTLHSPIADLEDPFARAL